MTKPEVTQENNEPYSGQYFATVKNFRIPCNMFKPGERVSILIETLEKDPEITGGYLVGVVREEPGEQPTPIPLSCLIMPERTRIEVEAAQKKLG